MLFALQEDGTRIHADDAKKSGSYVCPSCGKTVFLAKGDVMPPYFSHRHNMCIDSWKYDMTEWHHLMQDMFDKEYQEIVVKHDGKTHRADVLIHNTAIEFQHSPMDRREFEERTSFFLNNGYRLVWVIDLSEPIMNDRLWNNGTAWTWCSNWARFDNVDFSNFKNFALWITDAYKKAYRVLYPFGEIHRFSDFRTSDKVLDLKEGHHFNDVDPFFVI